MNPYEVAPVLRRILKACPGASDIIFSPGAPPKVMLDGTLQTVPIREFSPLNMHQTEMLALTLLEDKKRAMRAFTQTGSAEVSLHLEKTGRFRVNVFRQRGSIAVIMRVIPVVIPTLEQLGLPKAVEEILGLDSGIVLVTGPAGSGKSSTLAALIHAMNQQEARHIITLENPIEFAFPRGKSIIHQRELGSDATSFADALNAALRQAPQIIAVGELNDRETLELALEATDAGRLILSTLSTADVSKTLERLIGWYSKDQEGLMRRRLSQALRFILSQRLLPRSDGKGRCLALEILKVDDQTRSDLAQGSPFEGIVERAAERGAVNGVRSLDRDLLQLHQHGLIDQNTALRVAKNPDQLSRNLGPAADDRLTARPAERSALVEDGSLDGLPIIGLDTPKGEGP